VLGGERGHSLALHRAVPSLLRARRLRGGAGQLCGVSAVFGVRDATGTGRRAVGHLNKSLRAVLATQTRLVPHLHPCVHALAAQADIELPGWASRGPAVWAAAGISSWRAFSGELAAYTVCSVASRLHDASWGSRGAMRAAAVRIGRAALEERRAIAFRPKKKSG
jgi:hypothetical protein